jgi:hypothetical protein
MKRLAIVLALMTACALGQTVNTNILPSATGLNLGSSSQRWDLFAQDINLRGTLTLNGIPTYEALPSGVNDDCLVKDSTVAIGLRFSRCSLLVPQFHSVEWESPASADSGKWAKKFTTASVLSAMSCDTDTGTIDVQLQTRTSPNVVGTNSTSTVTCNSTGSAPATITNATIPANGYVAIMVSSITGAPTTVRVHFTTN